jgi:hypothetical protein
MIRLSVGASNMLSASGRRPSIETSSTVRVRLSDGCRDTRSAGDDTT